MVTAIIYDWANMNHNYSTSFLLLYLALLFKMEISMIKLYFYQQLINVLYLNYRMEIIEFKSCANVV